MPYDQAWHDARANSAGTTGPSSPPAFRTLYEQSLTTHADHVPAATVAVEAIRGDVLLSAGGDDQVWPADAFARDIVTRRAAAALHTEYVTVAAAGHRLQFPGEDVSSGDFVMARGGSASADQELGQALWRQLRAALHLE